MGTDMTAFIEYDKNEYYHNEWPGNYPIKPPFTSDIDSVSEEEGLFTGSKDYLFFNAIAGIRSKDEKKPLIEPRGLPEKKSVRLSIAIDNNVFSDLFGIGWLTLEEIEQSLLFQQVDKEELSFETHTILNIMNDLEKRCGKNRVRLIFGFDG